MSATINHHFSLSPALAGTRIDQAIATLLPDYSRANLQTWLKNGELTVNGGACKAKTLVKGKEEIVICAKMAPLLASPAQALALDIVHENDAFIILNKPVGLVVHPGAGNPESTLMNALLHYAPDLRALPRAGIIHRIDKGTSGLLVIAKTLTSHHLLGQLLQEHAIKREYIALVHGVMTGGGTVNAPLARHPKDRKRMTVRDDGKPAVTHYRLITRLHSHTLIRVSLETGRTHQIRAHMAHLGYPLVGDPVYGLRPKLPKQASPELISLLQQFNHQALHAQRLSFLDPLTQEPVHFEAPLPQDFLALINALKEHHAKHPNAR